MKIVTKIYKFHKCYLIFHNSYRIKFKKHIKLYINFDLLTLYYFSLKIFCINVISDSLIYKYQKRLNSLNSKMNELLKKDVNRKKRNY